MKAPFQCIVAWLKVRGIQKASAIEGNESPISVYCSLVAGENLWLDLPIVEKLLSGCRALFPSIGYAFAGMPTYASGQIGFVMASTNPVCSQTTMIFFVGHLILCI